MTRHTVQTSALVAFICSSSLAAQAGEDRSDEGSTVLRLAQASTPSAAQSEGADEPDRAVEEVLVTGSRLMRHDYRVPSPIVTVDASQFRDTGAPTIEAALNALPQAVASISSTSNNPSNRGQANVSLRGLGANRTLVLLDGRRIVPSQANGVVDLNLIPAAIIESVEVITGGASAVYGSDAIAGVVNIRTRALDGLQFTANYGETAQGDGGRSDFSIAAGTHSSDGRAYAFGTANFATRESIMAGDREFSRVGMRWNGSSFQPSGSAQILQGSWDSITSNRPTQAAVDAYFSAQVPGYAPGTTGPSRNFGFNDDGTLFSLTPLVNFRGATDDPLQPVDPAGYTFNINGDLYLELPLERRSLFAKGGFRLTDDTELFGQVLWGNYTVDTHLPPGNITSLYVRPDNPNLDPAIRTLLASRPNPTQPFRFSKRFGEVGGRERHLEYDVLQTTVGATGRLPFARDWQWDLNASRGNLQFDDAQNGSVSRSAFYQLALAPDHGAAICGSAIDPFGIGSLQPACVDHIVRNSLASTELNQTVVEGFVRGALFNLPAGEVQTALGLMYKSDDYALLTDDALLGNVTDPVTGSVLADVSGWGPLAEVRGATHSTELYAEANFPLLADKSFANKVELTLGGRLADHSNAGRMASYKAEGIWAITEALTLRGGYQRAVRAPSIGELFRAVGNTLQSSALGDPCSMTFNDPAGNVLGAQQNANVRALCIAQGIPSAAIDSFVYTSATFNALAGGNPELEEETADTYTAGIVFRGPEGWLAGLQGSVDYYQIKMNDAVGAIQAGLIVNRCFDTRFNPNLDNSNFYCQFFRRDAATGVVTDALAVDTNIAGNEIRGVDYQLDYSAAAGPGTLTLRLLASNLLDWKQTPIEGDAFQELAGTAGSSWNVLPKWKFTTSLGYSWGGFDGAVNWRRVGSTHDVNVTSFRLEAVDYADVNFGYRFSGSRLEGLTVRLGINNVTDQDPVIYPTFQQVNTDPSAYDVLGRRYFLSATYSLE